MDLNTRLGPSQQENSEKKSSIKANSIGFIQSMKEEIRKISWTEKSELISLTKIVVITTFVFGMCVYGVDLAIKGALDLIAYAFKSIFG